MAKPTTRTAAAQRTKRHLNSSKWLKNDMFVFSDISAKLRITYDEWDKYL